jgi:hypothetical protein
MNYAMPKLYNNSEMLLVPLIKNKFVFYIDNISLNPKILLYKLLYICKINIKTHLNRFIKHSTFL